MEVKKWKQSDLLLAVFFNVIVLGIVFLIFEPYFETNDDSTMAWISEGGTAGYSDRLVYINILYGKLIKALNMCLPGIRWYSVVFFVIMFFSFTVIIYVFLKLWERKKAILFSLTFLAIFAYYEYVCVQFSRVAGLSTVAGVLLVFYSLDKNVKNKILLIIFGIVLALTGSLIRFNVFLMCCAVMCGLGLWKMAEFYNKGGWKELKKILPYIGVMASLGVFAIGLRMYDTYAYNSQPEWKAYREYDSLRSQIIDYGFPSYEENPEVYDSLGLNSDDVWFYQNWNFADPEKFNVESMEKILELRPDKEIDGEFVKGFFTTLIPGLFKESAFVYLCVSLLISCIWFHRNRLIIFYGITAGLVIQLYLYYQGRYLMARVDDSIWLALLSIILYTGAVQVRESAIKTQYVFILILAFIGINGGSLFSNIFGDDTIYLVEEEQEMVTRISEDKDHLYCTATLAFGTDNLYSLWNRAPEYILSNVYSMGGWQTNSPLTQKVKEEYGIDNLFRDCLNNKNIYLIVGNQREITENYIRRHYSSSAVLEPVKEIAGEIIYRVVDEQWQPEEKEAGTEAENIVENLKLSKSSDGTYQIKGAIYKENSNSYNQNIYIKMQSQKTGETKFVFGCQIVEDYTCDINDGLYGNISQKITVPEGFGDNIGISVILEADDQWYEFFPEMA